MENKDEIQNEEDLNVVEETTPLNPQDDLPETEGEVASLQKKCDEYLDKLQRTLAEYDNFRKRTLREKAGMYNDGIADTVLKILPVIDNFERAIASYEPAVSDTFFKGVEMILKQMHETLIGLDVEEIPAKGEQFDPTIHSAIMHVDDADYGENVVAEVIQKGYKFQDRVLRPSMVKVAN